MAGPLRLLGISGSLRAGSHNARLLQAAAAALPPGAELVVWDRLADLPVYAPETDVDPAPEAVEDLRRALRDADGLLVSTPEYNGTIPGGLKNAIDWASRPRGTAALQDLPTAVVGATTGLFGAVWAQADARRSLGIAGADVVERELPVGQADAAFAPEGDRLAEPELQGALEALLDELAAKARDRSHSAGAVT
jgi:chromate reductase, NAD(P)H dehydrogenase (quinone)